MTTNSADRSLQRSVDEAVGEVSSNFHLAGIHRSRGDAESAEMLLRTTREFARSARRRPAAGEDR